MLRYVKHVACGMVLDSSPPSSAFKNAMPSCAPVGRIAYKPWYSGTIPTSRAAASTWLVPPDERTACCWDSWCLTSPLPPPLHAPAHPWAASLWCLPASLHEQPPTCASFLPSSGVVTVITIHSAISSLTTSLPHTIYPLTVRLRAISPFFLAHIAHRTYPSTTACLLTVSDKKVTSMCKRTYVVIRWSLVAPPLNSRYCALRPTVCLPSLSTSCTRGHVTAAPSCQARLLPMESSSNYSTNCDREIYSSPISLSLEQYELFFGVLVLRTHYPLPTTRDLRGWVTSHRAGETDKWRHCCHNTPMTTQYDIPKYQNFNAYRPEDR